MVDSKWVKGNYQKMTVVDPRFKAEYAEEHIPGAISAVYLENSKKSIDFDSSKDTFDMGKLPADKNTPIIVIGNDKH
jgi:rhodanese-related sulfurtransferase